MTDYETVANFYMNVKLNGIKVYSQTVDLGNKVVYPNTNYCYNYSYAIPSIAPNVRNLSDI